MWPISEEEYIDYSIKNGIVQKAQDLFVETIALKTLIDDPQYGLLARSALKTLKELIED